MFYDCVNHYDLNKGKHDTFISSIRNKFSVRGQFLTIYLLQNQYHIGF